MGWIRRGVLVWAIATSVAAVSGQTPPPQTVKPPQKPPATIAPKPGQPATDPQVKPEQLPEPPKPIGIVTGRVTGPGGAPIERARVVLSPVTPPTTSCSGSPEPLACNRITLTDADGRYTLPKLPLDLAFTVSATKSGFWTTGFGQPGPDAPATPITLRADQPEQTPLKEPLKANVDIALTQELVVVGHIQDEDGTPFSGALVQAQRFTTQDGKTVAVDISDTSTDDNGEFHLIGLPPGRYLIAASDPTFSNAGDALGPLDYLPTYFPGTSNANDATVMTLEAGKPRRTGVDFKLHIVAAPRAGKSQWSVALRVIVGAGLALLAAIAVLTGARVPSAPRWRPAVALVMVFALVASAVAHTLPARVRQQTQTTVTQTKPKNQKPQTPPPPPPAPQPARGVITGHITSLMDGQPIARARVIVSSATDSLPRDRVVLTDADGKYTVTDLPVGDGFVITAMKSGYAARAFGETPPAIPPIAVPLILDQRFVADIPLIADVLLTGRVLDDKTGTPLEGALVEAQRVFVLEGGNRAPGTVTDALTDEEGRYRLHGLPPGRYYVSAFDPTYATVGDSVGPLFYSPTFYPGEVVMDDAVPILLDPSRPPTESVEFRVQIIRPSRVNGAIVTSTGEKLTAGNVIMSPRRSDQVSSLTTSGVDIKVNDTFEFANIQPDKYRIVARGATERLGTTLFSQYQTDVSGIDTSVGTMTMSKGAVVMGRVTYSSHGHTAPVAKSIRIRAPGADGSRYGDTPTGIEPNGSFRINGVMAGLHFIRVENLPDPWRLSKVYLGGSDVTDIPYDFHYEDTLEGVVLEITDQSLGINGTLQVTRRDVLPAYVVITMPASQLLRYPGSRYLKLVRPDQSGRFRVTGLPLSDYIVVATRDSDEGDLDNPKALEKLAALPGAQHLQRWREDTPRGVTLYDGAIRVR